MMRFFQDMSYQDISRRLNISSENARKRIQHARTIIQDQLNPYLRGTGDPQIERKEGANQVEDTCELPSEHSEFDELKNDLIKPCIAPYRLICVKLRNEMEMEYYVPLKSLPKRVQQKIRTLRKYVQKHPGSWRKKWEFADLLYVAGSWPDAVDYYRQCLEQRLGRRFQDKGWQRWQELGRLAHVLRLGIVPAWNVENWEFEEEKPIFQRVVDGYNDQVRAAQKWL